MTITLTFEPERETKRTIRFAEIPEPGREPRVGTLYVSKNTVADLGSPERLTVTIGG